MAREVILALPHELSEEQRLTLTRDMALYLVSKYGVAVDMAIHAPMPEHSDDPRNHHAHLLFTTRVVKQDGLGEKTRILDDKEQGPQQIELIRSVWEALANAALQQAGFESVKIDRRTLEAQGIDRIPQEHVGKAGTHGDTPADDTDEPRKQDEEDEDGETDTGKTGSGDKAHTPSTAKKEPSSSFKEKVAPVKHSAETRLGLNEEIKRINAQRAVFSPVPLKDQIKELNRLIDRLDGRVQRLKTLSEKTSLPARIANAIVGLFYKAKDLFAVRTMDEAAQNLRATERDTKAKRQRARYGRTYRAHISERMAEMRQNIEILQTRQKQHQRYRSFVDLIERRVESIRPTLKIPTLPARTEWKAATGPQEIKTKIATEAIQKREKIPIEYRPTVRLEPLSKAFISSLRADSLLATMGTESTPVKTLPVKTLPVKALPPITPAKDTMPLVSIAVTKGKDSQRPEKSFTSATSPPPKDEGDRAVWHKEVIVKIKSLDEARTQRVSIQMDTPQTRPSESPLVWKIEANERGRIILERMQADIREKKAVMFPESNKEGFSRRFDYPVRIIAEGEVIEKVQTEAKTARVKIPTDIRAEAYDFEPLTILQKDNQILNAFKTAGGIVPHERSRKMSNAFNTASKASLPTEKQTAPEPKPKPQI